MGIVFLSLPCWLYSRHYYSDCIPVVTMVTVSQSLPWRLCPCHYHGDCIPVITLVIVFLSLLWWLQVTSSWWRSPSHCFWHHMTSATSKPTSRLHPRRMESSLATSVNCFLPFRTLSNGQQCLCLMIHLINSTPTAAVVLFRHRWCYIYSDCPCFSHWYNRHGWLGTKKNPTFTLSVCLAVEILSLSFRLSAVNSSCGLVYDMSGASNSQCGHHVTCKHCQQCVVLHVLALHMTRESKLAIACVSSSGLPATCPECKIARSVFICVSV